MRPAPRKVLHRREIFSKQSPPHLNGRDFEGHLATNGTEAQTTGYTQHMYDAAGNRAAVTEQVGTPQQRSTFYLVDSNTSYAQVVLQRNGILQARWVVEWLILSTSLFKRIDTY